MNDRSFVILKKDSKPFGFLKVIPLLSGTFKLFPESIKAQTTRLLPPKNAEVAGGGGGKGDGGGLGG